MAEMNSFSPWEDISFVGRILVKIQVSLCTNCGSEISPVLHNFQGMLERHSFAEYRHFSLKLVHAHVLFLLILPAGNVSLSLFLVRGYAH